MKTEPVNGNMGLGQGIWSKVANATAMVVIAVLVFVLLAMMQQNNEAQMQRLERIAAEQRELFREVHAQAVKALDQNTQALRELANTIRAESRK